MKRIAILIASLMVCVTMSWAQSGMTDNQVMDYVIEQNAKGTSRQQIVTQLMQRGVTIEQIRRLQKKYQKQMKMLSFANYQRRLYFDNEKNNCICFNSYICWRFNFRFILYFKQIK